MPRIKILDKKIAELISAGEVVERPASVVKELLENSIDSGATRIEVEIKRGGVSFIRITDNGCGIEKSDIRTAFKRHATSKISAADDLFSIKSLGFRGEALASISSVSKLSIITKPANAAEGILYELHGAAETNFQDIGCPDGTTILVEDLFFNTPARLKFLKTDSSEGNAVASIVDKIALSHPEISFDFIKDGKQVLHTPGNGDLRATVYTIYGKEFTDSLLDIKYEYKNIHISGLVCKPEFARSNRNMQHFFINKRYVKSKTASASIEQAFKGSIIVGKFPSCILNISVPTSAVDVNVHPAKIEVRFVDERPIFEAIYHACKSVLMENQSIKKLNLKPQKNLSDIITTSKVTPQNRETPSITTLNQNKLDKAKSQPLFEDSNSNPEPVQNQILDNFQLKIFTKNELISDDPSNFKSNNKDENPEVSSEKINKDIPNQYSSKIQNVFNSYKYIAEVFSTYIIVETPNDELIFIDKHAAHEGLIYEKLKSQKSNSDKQILLKPVVVTLERREYSALYENLPSINALGFDVEDFGNGKFIVRAVPTNIDDITGSIEEIAECFLEHKTDTLPQKLDSVYHTIACKAATKAGDLNNKAELIRLVENLKKHPQTKHCPHGRPIFTILSKRDIAKQFDR